MAAAPTTILGEESADDAQAGRKKRMQESKIPIASGMGSPSTAASPGPIVSSASERRTPAQAAAKSRAKGPERAAAQAECPSDDESDADNLAGAATADVKPRAARDLELLAARGGARRAQSVVSTSSAGAAPESTPEVGVTQRAAAPGGAAALHEQAVYVEVAAAMVESNDLAAAPKKPADAARNAAKANAPAASRGRPKPPDPTGSAAAKRIARPQQAPHAPDAAKASPPTEASAAEGVERDEHPTKAGDDDSEFNSSATIHAAVTPDAAPQRKSVQSDMGPCAGESSISVMSAGREFRDGHESQSLVGRAKRPSGSSAKASAKGGVKASAKSGANVAQRASLGTEAIASTPEPPGAKMNFDACATSSASSAGKPAAPSQATTCTPERSRSDGEGSFEGRFEVEPQAPSPRAVGAVSASSSIVSIRMRDKVAGQAASADDFNQVEAQTDEFIEKGPVDDGKLKTNNVVLSMNIAFGDVVAWVNALPLDVELLKKVTEDEVEFTQCCCFSRRRSASSIPGLNRRCRGNKDRVLLLNSTECDFNDLMHFRMLRAAYTKLTRNEVCPMIGKHWELLGFQHTDPCQDLNRTGRLLSVVHLFFFATHHFDILKSVYLLAHDEKQNFPLACICTSLTQMVVQCLIEGKLSRLCNASDKDVLDTTCKIFAASLFYFYMRWKTLKRTVRDTEVAMKELRSFLEKKPTALVQGLAKGVEALKQQASASKFEYTDLDFARRAPGAGGAHLSPDMLKRLRNYMAHK